VEPTSTTVAVVVFVELWAANVAPIKNWPYGSEVSTSSTTTCWVNAVDVEVLKLMSPEYCAVTVLVDAVSELTV